MMADTPQMKSLHPLEYLNCYGQHIGLKQNVEPTTYHHEANITLLDAL
jgi:hypothetical protein